LDHGADATLSYVLIRTSLIPASQFGHLDICKLLIARGDRNNIPRAFNAAVYSGYIPIMRFLVAQGTVEIDSDVNCTNEYRLKSAAKDGMIPVARYLVEELGLRPGSSALKEPDAIMIEAMVYSQDHMLKALLDMGFRMPHVEPLDLADKQKHMLGNGQVGPWPMRCRLRIEDATTGENIQMWGRMPPKYTPL